MWTSKFKGEWKLLFKLVFKGVYDASFKQILIVFGEVVNSIVDEIGLLHPIYYDVYDLCQYQKTNKLSQFNVSMLKNIPKNYEVPFTAKDRKKDLVQHLAIFVEKCSCFL